MFALTVMSVATLAVAYSAVVLVDCSIASLQLPWTDPLALCVAADSIGLGSDPWLGAGLAVVSLLALAGTWLPLLRRYRHRRRVEPERSLSENLSRIVDTTVQPEVADAEAEAEAEAEIVPSTLESRVSELESAMAGSSVPPRQAITTWMGLLREVNDLHNDGELPTEEYKEINTRLLDLVDAPMVTARP